MSTTFVHDRILASVKCGMLGELAGAPLSDVGLDELAARFGRDGASVLPSEGPATVSDLPDSVSSLVLIARLMATHDASRPPVPAWFARLAVPAKASSGSLLVRVASVGYLAATGRVGDPFVLAKTLALNEGADKVTADACGLVAGVVCGLVEGRHWGASFDGAARQFTDGDHSLARPLGDVLRRADSRFDLDDPATVIARGLRVDFDRQPFEAVTWTAREVLARYVSQDRDSDDMPDAAEVDPGRADVALLQAVMVCRAAQGWAGTPVERVRWARTLAVTQGGASGTVGALVGVLMGAQVGPEAVYDDWDAVRDDTPFGDAGPLSEALAWVDAVLDGDLLDTRSGDMAP